MQVFRRRSALTCFALLALLVQAVLAFAQTHAHAHMRPHATAAGLETRAITFGACSASVERPCPPPARHDDGGHCPACLSISLASSAVLHQPPAVSPLHPRVDAPLPVRAAAPLCSDAPIHFQARAPPLA